MNTRLKELAKSHCDFRVNYVSVKELPDTDTSDFLFVYDRKMIVKMSLDESKWEKAYLGML